MSLNAKYLADLFQKHNPSRMVETESSSSILLGSEEWNWVSIPKIMGVINLSPDSWYRESVCLSAEAAIKRGRVLMAQGADIIDVGAESSLNSADRVDSQKQLSRVLPVLKELSTSGATISLETYRSEVAIEGVKAGAKVINLTGYQEQEAIFEMAADKDLALVLCFVDGDNVRTVDQLNVSTDDPMPSLMRFFESKIELATRYGAKNLILDAGLGFYYRNLLDGKRRVEYQIRAFLESYRLGELGYPVCNALPHAFEYFGEEVRVAESFFATLASLGGTHCFRTHEVARVKPIIEIMNGYGS